MKLFTSIFFSLCSSLLLSQEICNNGLDDDNDGFVDYFDSDCDCNIVNKDNYYYICGVNPCSYTPSSGIGVALKWQVATNTDAGRTTPLVADLDNNGTTEVISRGTNVIAIFNGLTGALIQNIATAAMVVDMSAPAIADVNNDGRAEIFTFAGGQVVCYAHNGTNYVQSWATTVSGVGSPNLNIADFNYDGVPEILAGNVILNAQSGIVYASGVGSFGRSITSAFTVAADVLPDGACPNCSGLEIIAGNQVYAVNINVGTPALSTINIEVNLSTELDGRTSIADVDRDGDLDAVITPWNGGAAMDQIYVWDLQTPTLLAPKLSGPFRGQANIGDFNGDGIIDFGVVGVNRYTVLSYNSSGLSQLWQINTNDGSAITGSTLFDFDADGAQELVYRDETNLRILNGSTGINITTIPCNSSTRCEYPVVADVDNDGESEIVVTESNSLRVYESDGSSRWAPSRNVWNQHCYFNVNINDNLTIPRQQQNHGIIDDSLKMNTFLAQYSNPEFVNPNAYVNILPDTSCFGDTLLLSYSICNDDALLPIGFPSSIYIGNPFKNGATLYKTNYTSVNLIDSSCQQFSLKIHQNDMTDTLYIIANDSGNQSLPLNIGLFPYNGVEECSYTNNIKTYFHQITYSVTPTHVLCFDSLQGRIDISSSFYYEYSLDSGTNRTIDQFFPNLQAKNYTVRAYNDAGCYKDTIITINQPARLTIQSLGIKDERCFELCDGKITLTGNGGVRPYVFDVNGDLPINGDSIFGNLCSTSPHIAQITDNNGCFDSIHFFLTPPLALDFSVDILEDCVDKEMTINASAIGGSIDFGNDYVYHWDYTNTLSGSSQTFVAVEDTLIYVFATDDSLCHTDTIEINMHINPLIDFTANDLLCFGNNTGSIEVLNQNVYYSLDFAPFQNTLPIYSGLSAGLYSLRIQNQFNCIGDTTLEISEPTPLIYTDSVIDASCFGYSDGQIQLFARQATPPYSFSINNGVSFFTDSIFLNLKAKSYPIIVKDANNCLLTSTLIVAQPDSFSVITSPSICIEDSSTITSITENGITPFIYSWSNGSTQNKATVLPSIDTRYSLSITDAHGCFDTASTLIRVMPQPNFTVDKIEDCNPATFLFTNTSNVQNSLACIWDYGDGKIENDCNSEVSHKYFNDGVYSITLFINEANGCYKDTTITNMVHSKIVPQALFSYIPESPSVIKNLVHFQDLSVDAQTYSWKIENQEVSTSDTLTYEFPSEQGGIYNVCLSVDSNGCNDTYCDKVIVEPNVTIYIPSAFSPNGDGFNELFGPVVNGMADVKLLEFAISDRWGNKIFSSNQFEKHWDGTVNSVACPNDVYIWYIRYQILGKYEITFQTGQVFLLK